jgi:hypothetical protein
MLISKSKKMIYRNVPPSSFAKACLPQAGFGGYEMTTE